ncbi:complement decay-accelerating factor isoform 2-T2 [Molossus nigricans]
MSPCWGGTPAVLRLLGGLTLLLLLLCPHAARGDCSLPPDIPNAQPDLKGLTSFPNKKVVTYKCNKGFVKVPGEPDSVICLENVWSSIKEFCNRSCNVPTRLLFATLKKPYNTQNYFPSGSVVEYECRLGFKRDHSLSGNLTCLQNFTWSKSDEFCKKKSCPNPGKIINGNVIIKTDILYGSSISFSCNTGYKLVGSDFNTCVLKGNSVDWSYPLPECKESSPISKPTSTPQKPTKTDVPGTKPPSTPQKSTTVNVSATEGSSTPQKPTTTDVPATQGPAVAKTTTSVHSRSTSKGSGTISAGLVAGTIIIGIPILVKFFWDRRKSGSYYTHENHKALNVMFHDLTETDDASEVRPGKL